MRGDARIETLAGVLNGRSLVALTGAGCSTESGIPDYRGPGRAGPPRNPILHDAFVKRSEVRQRYWARATLGWSRMVKAQPNPAHATLATWEGDGLLRGVITQNVDRLHHRAGSRRVIELHGALEEVECLACRAGFARADVHARMLAANPGWLDRVAAFTPDGDADLDATTVAGFHVVGCPICAGPLKPAVVFFGGTVGADVVAAAFALLESAEVLLIVGSSLAVYSGYRFVRRAAERGMTIVILNQGPTRGDAHASLCFDGRAGEVLPALDAYLRRTVVAR